MAAEKKTGLALLREPFAEHHINKKPQGTKAQNECPPNEKQYCKICNQYHHPRVIHLDYVGHAALTDRLLDADPAWYWEPLALKDGLPAFDANGGLWIKLTVCGVTRLGYGNAAPSQFKEIGSREKEVIGDALRNAAMRFGAALELWFKGDLHKEDDDKTAANATALIDATHKKAELYAKECEYIETTEELKKWFAPVYKWAESTKDVDVVAIVKKAYDRRKAELIEQAGGVE